MTTSKTLPMKIYCGECAQGFDMSYQQLWYNIEKEKYRHPIGFCSPDCTQAYIDRHPWWE